MSMVPILICTNINGKSVVVLVITSWLQCVVSCVSHFMTLTLCLIAWFSHQTYPYCSTIYNPCLNSHSWMLPTTLLPGCPKMRDKKKQDHWQCMYTHVSSVSGISKVSTSIQTGRVHTQKMATTPVLPSAPPEDAFMPPDDSPVIFSEKKMTYNPCAILASWSSHLSAI